MPDTAKSVVWCGDLLCIGFKKEYNLIHSQTGARTELFPTGKSGIPIATLLPNEQVLLGRDSIPIQFATVAYFTPISAYLLVSMGSLRDGMG